MSRFNPPHGSDPRKNRFGRKVRKLKRDPTAFLRDAELPWLGKVLQPGSLPRMRLEAKLTSLGLDHRRWLPQEPPPVSTTTNGPPKPVQPQHARTLAFLDSFPSGRSLQGRRFLD